MKYFKEYTSNVKKTNKFNVYMRKYSNLGNSLLKHNKNADAIRLKISMITVKYYVISMKNESSLFIMIIVITISPCFTC